MTTGRIYEGRNDDDGSDLDELCPGCRGAGIVEVIWESSEDNDPGDETPKGGVCPMCNGLGVNLEGYDEVGDE
jgi:hypothetical protein